MLINKEISTNMCKMNKSTFKCGDTEEQKKKYFGVVRDACWHNDFPELIDVSGYTQGSNWL